MNASLIADISADSSKMDDFRFFSSFFYVLWRKISKQLPPSSLHASSAHEIKSTKRHIWWMELRKKQNQQKLLPKPVTVVKLTGETSVNRPNESYLHQTTCIWSNTHWMPLSVRLTSARTSIPFRRFHFRWHFFFQIHFIFFFILFSFFAFLKSFKFMNPHRSRMRKVRWLWPAVCLSQMLKLIFFSKRKFYLKFTSRLSERNEMTQNWNCIISVDIFKSKVLCHCHFLVLRCCDVPSNPFDLRAIE